MTDLKKPLAAFEQVAAFEREMDAKFISGKQAVESGLVLFKDLLEAVTKGGLTAYADTGPVTICACHEDNGDYPDSFPLDRWGRLNLNEAEQREMTEMANLQRLLSARWRLDIRLKKRIALPLMKQLKLDSFSGKDNLFLFPMDDVSIKNMGLATDQHKKIFLGFAFERNRLPAATSWLDPRIARTDLQIIRGLLAELKINIASPHATGQILKILERNGVSVDRETLAARIKELRNEKRRTT